MRTLKREITDDPIVQRIIYALKENGKTANDLIKYLKVGKNIFDTWKFSGSKSYMSYIDKIADFTGTSIDFLVRGVEMDGSTFTGAEQELVLRYRKLNEKRQRMIWNLLKDFESLTELDVEK